MWVVYKVHLDVIILQVFVMVHASVFCVTLCMLVFCWLTLTEGHGSCTLSVWTLAEPLGVLFQARSDNLAPTTRLATAQFTGRSSTQATPSPHRSYSQLLLSLLSFPLSSPCTLLHLSILPSLLSQLSQYLLPCCYLTQTFRLSLLFLSISMTLLWAEQKRKASVTQTRAPASLPTATHWFFWIPEYPDQACFISYFVDRRPAKRAGFKATTFQETKIPQITFSSFIKYTATVSWLHLHGNHSLLIFTHQFKFNFPKYFHINVHKYIVQMCPVLVWSH